MINYILIVLIACSFSRMFPQQKFVIGTVSANSGFFSHFLGVINGLLYCDKNNKIPVIDFSKAAGGEFLYAKYEALTDIDNPWEYYFEPASDLHYEPGDEVYHGYGVQEINIGYNHPESYNPELRFACNAMIKKYITIKPRITLKINHFYHMNMQNRVTIGIHLRGTDKYIEVQPVDPMIILQKANHIAKVVGYNCQFFIATDEEKLLTLAQSTLQGKVIYYCSGLSRVRLGEEILIEAYLLSLCHIFIHTLTNISQAVSYLSPTLKTILIPPVRAAALQPTLSTILNKS